MSFNSDLQIILSKNKNKKALIDVFSGTEITYGQLSENISAIQKFIRFHKIY